MVREQAAMQLLLNRKSPQGRTLRGSSRLKTSESLGLRPVQRDACWIDLGAAFLVRRAVATLGMLGQVAQPWAGNQQQDAKTVIPDSSYAGVYEAVVDDMVDNLTALMEPMIMSVLGVLVGGLIVAMYLPIFQMGQVVG